MHLDDWTRIKSGYTDNLILGNGASIAIKPALSYRSLHDEVKNRGKLSPELLRLFEAYETSNFEFILRLLLESNQVNKYLGIEDTKTKKYYTQLRNALISTILELHPKYEIVQHFLPKMFLFLKRYETVLSLNYDTLVYWAMLYGNEKLGYTHFKDCFVRGTFENDFKYLYTPAGSADDVTLVFYPHGSLFLASNICGDETKLSRTKDDYLLDTILAKWNTETFIPLFVSEGSSKEKFRAIGRSNYLNTVYNAILSDMKGSVLIYGWSMSEQDQHILEALDHEGITSIGISVFTEDKEWESKCLSMESKIKATRHLKETPLTFFNSRSNGCWIY